MPDDWPAPPSNSTTASRSADGVEGETGYGLDAQLGGDVLTMGKDGVQADVQLIGDLFIRDAFYDQLKYVYLTAG